MKDTLHIERQNDTFIDRQNDIFIDRQNDTHIDRQNDTHTYRQRDKVWMTFLLWRCTTLSLYAWNMWIGQKSIHVNITCMYCDLVPKN